jgi:amidase
VRLRRAGAVVIGKTTMPELAIWPFTESDAFGITRNPWNTDRTTGGSSGGSAAAVAARMAPIALGSDGGGSIRIPAASCGLPGLKPGPGVIPLAGGVAEHWYGMSEFGPIARTADDVALMFDVLRGVPPRRVELPATPLKIAVTTRPANPGSPVSIQVRQAVERMADVVASAGHVVESADPPYGADVGLRFGRRWFPGIAEDAQRLSLDALEPRNRSLVKIGRFIERRGWQRRAADDPFGARMRAWLAPYDVLLTFTLNVPPVAIGKWGGKGWFTTVMGVANWVNTAPWNLARFPAATVPAGLTNDGLPMGIQLIAKPGDEGKLLALMTQIEKLQPWPVAPG